MEYYCNICNKKYVSYKILWNHNSKYHRNNVVINLPETENNVVINSPENKVLDNRTCKYCKKKLCDRKYRWKHEQNCKSKNSNDIELLKIEMEKKIEDNEKKSQKENHKGTMCTYVLVLAAICAIKKRTLVVVTYIYI